MKYDLNCLNIDTFIKPTNHIQYCSCCFKDLKKGENIVRTLVGTTRNRYPDYKYFHPMCFALVIAKKVETKYLKLKKKVLDVLMVDAI